MEGVENKCRLVLLEKNFSLYIAKKDCTKTRLQLMLGDCKNKMTRKEGRQAGRGARREAGRKTVIQQGIHSYNKSLDN